MQEWRHAARAPSAAVDEPMSSAFGKCLMTNLHTRGDESRRRVLLPIIPGLDGYEHRVGRRSSQSRSGEWSGKVGVKISIRLSKRRKTFRCQVTHETNGYVVPWPLIEMRTGRSTPALELPIRIGNGKPRSVTESVQAGLPRDRLRHRSDSNSLADAGARRWCEKCASDSLSRRA